MRTTVCTETGMGLNLSSIKTEAASVSGFRAYTRQSRCLSSRQALMPCVPNLTTRSSFICRNSSRPEMVTSNPSLVNIDRQSSGTAAAVITSEATARAGHSTHYERPTASLAMAALPTEHSAHAPVYAINTREYSEEQHSLIKPWWVPHQQVLFMLSSSFWPACTLVGCFFWVTWAVKRARKPKASTKDVSKQNSSEVETTQASTSNGVSGKADPLETDLSRGRVVDNLDDPFAPIKYILEKTFQKKQPAALPLDEATGSTAVPGVHSQLADGKAIDSTENLSPDEAYKQGPGEVQAQEVVLPAQPSVTSKAQQATSGQTTTSSNSSMHAASQLHDRWWAELHKVYYINFGAKLGIQPRLSSLSESTIDLQAPAIVAFADRADAEFVSGTLRASMTLATAPLAAAQELQAATSSLKGATSPVQTATRTIRPMVVATNPIQLDDISRTQGATLLVVPQGKLQPYYNMLLTENDLLSLLGDLALGREPAVRAKGPTQERTNSSVGAGLLANNGNNGNSVQSSTAVPADEGVTSPAAHTLAAGMTSSPATFPRSDTAGLPQPMRTDANTSQPTSIATLDANLANLPSGFARFETAPDRPPIPDMFDFPGFDEPVTPQQEQPQTQLSTATQTNSSGLSSAPAKQQAALNATSMDVAGVNTADGEAEFKDIVTPTVIEPGSTANNGSVSEPEVVDVSIQASEGLQSNNPTQDSSVGADDVLEEDPLLREYQMFKKIFEQARAPKPQPTAPAAQHSQQQPKQHDEAHVLPDQQADAHDSTPVQPDSNRDQVSQRQHSSVTEDLKSSPEKLVERLLAEEGPTDKALTRALSAIAVPDKSTPDELLEEWYALQEQLLDDGDDASSSSFKQAVAARAAQKQRPVSGQASGQTGPSLESMQLQLSEMETQLQKLLNQASNTSSAGSQSRISSEAAFLQQRMQDLRGQMASVKDESSNSNQNTAKQRNSAASSNNGQDHNRQDSLGQTSQVNFRPARTEESSNDSTGATQPASPPSTITSSTAASQPTPAETGSSGGKRAWGSSWTKKPLAKRPSTTTTTSSQTGLNSESQMDTSLPQAQVSKNSTSTSSQSSASKQAQSSSSEVKKDDDGSVVVSKRIGRERPWKKTRDPAERHATVKEALRFVSSNVSKPDDDVPIGDQWDEDGNRLPPPDPSVDKIAGIDWDRVSRQKITPTAVSSSSSYGQKPAVDTGREKWWQRHFQALFFPNIRYEDGSVGFVQLDCSLVDGKRDMRVVTFEDRHDCMHCLRIMQQWPEYQWHTLEMGMLPTNAVEAEIVKAWQAQADLGLVNRDSRPAGVVVFRRGKLSMRVGMSQEDFTQVAVFQAAAQLSLSKVGYEFDDF